MASKRDLSRIGQEGFNAIDRAFGYKCTVPSHQEHRYSYQQNQVPLETIPSPYIVYQRTEVSSISRSPSPIYPPPLPGTPPRYQLSLPFSTKHQKPQAWMRERNQVSRAYQGVYGDMTAGRGHAAEDAVIDNYSAAELYGGVTRVDYGWF